MIRARMLSLVAAGTLASAACSSAHVATTASVPSAALASPVGAWAVAAAPPSRLTAAAPSAVGMSDALPARLDSIVTAAIADRASPGVVVAVARHGRLVVDRAWGKQDWAADAPPASDSTLYDMASLTKVVATTTAAMLLEDDGKLDIDRTVVSYVPEFDAPDKAPITLRMLLTHTSGMRQNQFLYQDTKGRAQYLAKINAKPLVRQPGAQYEYSDWSMIVLQAVVERVAGTTLDSLLAARVFGPLGMHDTQFNPPPTLKPRIAPTEIQPFRGGQVWGVVHDENAWAMGGVSGNAGLFASARDVAVFVQMLLNGGEYDGVRIIRPETVARWTARQRKDAARALGWETPSTHSSAGRYFSFRSFGHTGFTGTSIWADPEKQLFVVILSNRVDPSRDNPKLGPLRRAIADAVQQSVLDAPLRAWERDTTTR
jgi:CubicO group peptidase (beta-lactamase class C family)